MRGDRVRGRGTVGGMGLASAARREVAPSCGEEEDVLLESLSLFGSAQHVR